MGIFTELQRLGWVDGRNAIYEPRFSAGDPERLPSLASDLVGRKVDIIVATGGTVTARAAQRVKTTIPIVALSDDLEGEGLVTSLAHSGNNTTGVSMFAAELNAKRVELLAEMVPAAPHSCRGADAQRERGVGCCLALGRIYSLTAVSGHSGVWHPACPRSPMRLCLFAQSSFLRAHPWSMCLVGRSPWR